MRKFDDLDVIIMGPRCFSKVKVKKLIVDRAKS